MDFSVIVCNYNGSLRDIEFTLNSVINQENVNFEVIFSDDGSEENPYHFVKDFFDNYGFSKYKIRIGNLNIGTVCAIDDAMKMTCGKYIYTIGIGDALANNNVLFSISKYMNENNSKMLFTGIIPFCKSEGTIKEIDGFTIPRSLKCWENNNYETAKEHIIVFNDQISGCSMFWENNYMKYLMGIMKEHTIYMEDLCQYIALLEGEKIHYYPEKCILYESNTGISTNHSESNMRRMKEDKDRFLAYLFERYPSDTLLARRKKLEEIENRFSNRIIKGMMKVLAEPKWILFRINKIRG